jgi:D-alanine-D-alanine ligase-like ATP-grasp enzyme
MNTKAACPDCGNAPVNHFMHKFSVVMDFFVEKLNGVARPIMGFTEPLFNRFVDRYFPSLFKILTAIGVGHVVTAPDTHMNARERVFWEEGIRRGVKLWGWRMFEGANTLSVAEFNGKSLVFSTIPRPGYQTSDGSDWIDSKDKLREHFLPAGIPMARGGVVRSWNEAKTMFLSLTPPVIAKPARGSRSRHTTTHIDTLDELEIAYEKAKQLCPWVIIEEELIGLVHRGTVIGGKVVGILRREPAAVTGDGVHTVLELITKENENPMRQGPIFHQIELHDPEHDKELMRHGMTLKSIPPSGKIVTLSQKASRGLGGGATDVTDDAHPEIVRMLEKVAEVLGDSLVGIDFIIDDVRKPWRQQPRSGVIECNGAPFIDLHLFPLVGKPRNTPGALWDLLLKE